MIATDAKHTLTAAETRANIINKIAEDNNKTSDENRQRFKNQLQAKIKEIKKSDRMQIFDLVTVVYQNLEEQKNANNPKDYLGEVEQMMEEQQRRLEQNSRQFQYQKYLKKITVEKAEKLLKEKEAEKLRIRQEQTQRQMQNINKANKQQMKAKEKQTQQPAIININTKKQQNQKKPPPLTITSKSNTVTSNNQAIKSSSQSSIFSSSGLFAKSSKDQQKKNTVKQQQKPININAAPSLFAGLKKDESNLLFGPPKTDAGSSSIFGYKKQENKSTATSPFGLLSKKEQPSNVTTSIFGKSNSNINLLFPSFNAQTVDSTKTQTTNVFKQQSKPKQIQSNMFSQSSKSPNLFQSPSPFGQIFGNTKK